MSFPIDTYHNVVMVEWDLPGHLKEIIHSFLSEKSIAETNFVRKMIVDHLDSAVRYANQGNRFLMNYKIKEATRKYHDIVDHELDVNRLSHYTTYIHTLCTPEKERVYLANGLKQFVTDSKRHVEQGDLVNRDRNIRDVIAFGKKHRIDTTTIDKIVEEIKQIECTPEVIHKKRKRLLEEAKRYALKGNREFMLSSLDRRTRLLEYTMIRFDDDKEEENENETATIAAIKTLLTPERERAFHQQKLEDYILYAERYAKTGDLETITMYVKLIKKIIQHSNMNLLEVASYNDKISHIDKLYHKFKYSDI